MRESLLVLSPNDINHLESEVRILYEQASIEELTGLSYLDFERNPQRALSQAGQSDAPDLIRRGFRPLLPKQVRLRARLDAESATESMATRPEPTIDRSNVVRMHNAADRRRSA